MKAVLGVFLALALVAMTNADCSRLRRLKVMKQWTQGYGKGLTREEVGELAFKLFFKTHADTQGGIFKRVHGDNPESNEFRAHLSRVLGGFDQCISLLGDEATLQAQLAHLNKQHKDREGVKPEYFKDFGKNLMDALSKRIGRSFDRESFSACYTMIAEGITK